MLSLSVPVALAIVCFGFRFLLLPSFTNDHYLHLAWAQQLLFGELPGRDFVEPGMPLTVLASALAQWIRVGPLSEAILTIAMLSLATAFTCAATTRLTGSLTAGVVAAVACFALQPRLYSYPKILIPAATLVLAHAYSRTPSLPRAAILGMWTACAVLFRHDLGAYTAAAVLTLITLRGPARPGDRGWRHLAAFAGAAILALTPYLAYVTLTQGVWDNLRDGFEFAHAEDHQFVAVLPAVSFAPCLLDGVCRWSGSEAATYLAWLSRLLVPVAVVLLLVRRPAMPRAAQAPVAAAIALLALYGIVVLRHPLTARVADLAGVMPIVAVWVVVEIGRLQRATAVSPVSRLGRGALAVAAAAAMTMAVQSVTVLMQPLELLDRTRLIAGGRNIREHATSVLNSGLDWPWVRFWPTRSLPAAVSYIASCIGPSDRLLVTWSAPEYYFFSRRAFAGGHAVFLPPRAFTSPRDQRLMLQRLQSHSVPIVLANQTRYDEFAAAYPEVDAYIMRTYVPVGRFLNYDDSEIAVLVHRDRTALSAYGHDAWPCEFGEASGR